MIACPECHATLDRFLAGLTVAQENVELEIRSARTGKLLELIRARNIITNNGLNLLGQWHGGGEPAISDTAIGTDNTTPAATDTALVTEIFRAAVSQRSFEATQIVTRYFLASTAANGNTLREAGIFNPNNIMYSRVTHTDIAKTASLTVTYSWTHSFARA